VVSGQLSVVGSVGLWSVVIAVTVKPRMEQSRVMKIALIAVGGAAGAVLRYGVAGLVQGLLRGRPSEAFPWGTLLINISGCFLIGLLAPLLLERSVLRPEFRLAILVGFLGAYTTWSTFGFETMQLLNAGDYRRALAYALGTNLGCFAAVWLAYKATTWFMAAAGGE
jgi:fluoride exporter